MLDTKSNWLENLKLNKISKVLLPNINLESVDQMHDLCAENPEVFKPMMGLHPCDVKADFRTELEILKDKLYKNPLLYCGVGEIGLDYHWDLTYQKEQLNALETQFEWAIELDKGVSIHSRKSNQDSIPLIQKWSKKGLRGVMHCFSGSLEEAHQIIKAGFYLGIGGVLTYPKAGLQEVVSKISLEHLVLETDAPYISPVPFRGKQNESGYIIYIAQKLAEIKNCTIEEVAVITTINAHKIFSF